MSKLNRLIQELCPNGVEYSSVNDLIKQKIVYTVSASVKLKRNGYLTEGTTPIISQEEEFISGYTNITDKNICQREYVCFGDHSEHVKYVDFAFVQGADGLKIMYCNQDVLFAKYFYYAISNFYKKHCNYERHFKYLQELSIPLPPLPIQEEIVKILDRFAEYTAELQAELQARKEQYEYYRNLLLTNNFAYGSADDKQKITGIARGEWKWMTLGEVGTFTRGNGLQKKDFTESGVPCIHYGQIYTYYGTSTEKTKSFCSPDLARKLRKAKYGDLVIATTSENVDDVCKSVVYLGKEEACVSSDAFIYSHNQNPKYIGYFFQTYFFQKQKLPYITGTKVMRISDKALSKIQIPIPPLAEQQRIVSILDKFEALVSDLTQGLPAEIAASQERYEYYRDKLLRFERCN